uniref:Uncharacterized protein n=1 Tax=Helianthus annuus TaxID=4232 RepID=A0A251SYQ6_HELAN
MAGCDKSKGRDIILVVVGVAEHKGFFICKLRGCPTTIVSDRDPLFVTFGHNF